MYVIYHTEKQKWATGNPNIPWIDRMDGAQHFTTVDKANNWLKNAKIYHPDISFLKIQSMVLEQEVKENEEQTIEPLDEQDAIEYTNNLQQLILLLDDDFSDLPRYIVYLEKRVSDLDRGISDIYHKIEFDNISAIEYVRLGRLLKMTLRERRTYKNLHTWAQLFSRNNICTFGKAVQAKQDKLEKKAYEPQYYKELVIKTQEVENNG